MICPATFKGDSFKKVPIPSSFNGAEIKVDFYINKNSCS